MLITIVRYRKSNSKHEIFFRLNIGGYGLGYFSVPL